MSQLSKEDIDFLQRSLVQKEIKYDPLVDEILDHICCEVEDLMEAGMSFSDAYLRFSKSLQPKALKTLEDETIHLVNYKLFIMKKAIYILASIVISLFILGFLFRIMHWPGASQIFIIDLSLTAILLPIWTIYRFKLGNMTATDKVLFPVAAIFIFLFTSGSFFKIMHWPGAGIMAVIGLIGLAGIGVPYFFFSAYKKSLKS